MIALMRWDSLRIADDSPSGAADTDRVDASTASAGRVDASTASAGPASAGAAGQQALFSRDTVVTRTFDTPGFRGITFHEVHARSLISKVPEASRVPFRWTINPYRGCSHACVYCMSGDTPVLMADGRHKPIADVQVGG